MSWVDDEGDENEKREIAEQGRRKLIASSNYWERLVRQVEADVKAINGNEYLKTKLVGVPLEFCKDEDGYQISKSGCPGVIESATCETSHSLFSSSIERCTSSPPRHSKRFVPHGVRRIERSLAGSGAAEFEVFKVALPRIEPWQSMQSISTTARGSP